MSTVEIKNEPKRLQVAHHAPVGMYNANLSIEGGTSSSCLLLVDPQNDFVTGSLVVPGAVEDCDRIASFIKVTKNISQIFVSLDTHMQFHIAHKAFWYKLKLEKSPTDNYDWNSAKKLLPEAFDEVSFEAVSSFIVDPNSKDHVIRFVPQKEQFLEWALHYTKTLESNKGLKLVVWPDHCLIGSEGHLVQKSVYEALNKWEIDSGKSTEYIIKGHNSLTEHYSAFQAEVIVKEDTKTSFNQDLYEALIKHDTIYVAGEARSHCVNHSVRHLVTRMQQDGHSLSRICLLQGAMSDVPGAEPVGEKFWNDMIKAGVSSIDISNLV